MGRVKVEEINPNAPNAPNAPNDSNKKTHTSILLGTDCSAVFGV